ncbi:hypothetical protein NEFER03_1673 [Nematocida sp. LUAm3]|nr:hypothetical protein NEFER03_1673 [Nematocida sp. LUAm3]KAI5175663.1 hypothetical protein NEFER02_1550 [Nematocida sp. LUAm2]KAI5178569.1 hypothetical protein NEFER01_1705 [Nematocida sp. LUAm1]
MDNVEYQLRFLLDSMTLKVDRVTPRIAAKKESLLFLEKYKKQKIIHAFILQEDKPYTIAPFYGVPIKETELHHKLQYCQIAIGKPIFASEEYALNCKPPGGYDSFIVTTQRTNIEDVIYEHKKDKSFLSFRYVIPDKSRVLLLGEVEFTYDKALEDKYRNNDICEFCKEKPSNSFCLAERASFCDDCDKYFHSNEFTQRHNRHYFTQIGKKRFFHCNSHSSTVVDYFCTKCKEPLCTQCRIFGTHSESPRDKDKLISYIDACDYLKDALEEESEKLLSVQEKVLVSVQEVENEITSFEQNIASVRAKLDHEYKASLSALKDLVKRRFQKINPKYLEAKQLEELLKKAVSYPKEVDASVLVEKWKGIEEINRSLSESILPEAEEEFPIVVRGSLTVMLEKETSPTNTITAYPEDNTSRQRTEMLLKVSQFK